MKTTLVPVSGILTYWHLNRKRDDEHVRALATAINRDGFDQRYPVRIVKTPDGKLHLAAGYHRLAAAAGEHVDVGGGQYERDATLVNLPIEKIWADVVLGDLNDVVKTMQLDNFKHDPAVTAGVGKPLSSAQKKEQCKTLLGFPDYFGKSLALLETEFGIPKRTLANWKSDVGERIAQIASADLSDLELLNDYGFTRERLEKMAYLVKTGAVSGADGRVTKTQASADKKARARELAISDFRSAHDEVQKSIDMICENCTSLARETIKRRLYSHFDLSHETNASRWSVEKLASQAKAISALQAELSDLKKSGWAREFWNTHKVSSAAAELRGLGAPFLCEEVEQVLQTADFCKTGDFEVIDAEERRKELVDLAKEISDILQAERDLRAQKKAVEDAAAREEKARVDLEKSVRAATRACADLQETFGRSAIADQSAEGYEKFLGAACTGGRFSSRHLSVRHFLRPEEISDKDLGFRIAGIAKKIRLDIASSPPPKWIKPFLKVQNPPPTMPPAQNSDGNEQASAPVLPKSVYDPGALNLPPRPAPGNSLSEKSESESEDVRAPAPKSDNEKRADAVGDTPSPRSGISDLERALQVSIDSLGAVLPDGVGTAHAEKAKISEVIRETCADPLERLEILRRLLMGELSLLKKK